MIGAAPMLSHVFRRLLWMIPVLFGVSLLTFLLLDLVPVGRAGRRRPRSVRGLRTAQRRCERCVSDTA